MNSNKTSNVLELIHIDIYKSFPTASWDGQQYYISFIDNYSRYRYIYLIYKKSQSLDMFKAYKAKVENQHGKRIKVIRSDHGSDYYDKYNGLAEQYLTPFVRFLEEMV